MVLTERDLASAIFEAPHDGEAYAAVLSGATDMVADAGRAVVAARRSPDKVRGKSVRRTSRVRRCLALPPRPRSTNIIHRS